MPVQMTSGVLMQMGKAPQAPAPAPRTPPRRSLIGAKAVARVAREAAAAAEARVVVDPMASLLGVVIAHLLSSTWLPFRAMQNQMLDRVVALLREGGTRQ